MPVTNFAGKQFKRSAEPATPPLNWFDSSVKDIFALTSVRQLPGGHQDMNIVAYAADKAIVSAWVRSGVLPEKRDTQSFALSLTPDHVFSN